MSRLNDRDTLGLIDLNGIIKDNNSNTFVYDDKTYYFKECNNVTMIYNELIVEELALQYGIPCAHYDIGFYNDSLISFCENIVMPNELVIDIERLIKFYFPDSINVDKHNNLEDLWDIFAMRYRDSKITEKLMEQLVNIFIFDILIGNSDRHILNYYLLESDTDVNIGPIFDNENMLNENAIIYGGYDIGITEDDYFYSAHYLTEKDNFLLKFLNVSAAFYRDIIKDKLDLISEDNIENIFTKVEKRISSEINPIIKTKIKKGFKENRMMINNILSKTKVKMIS